MNAGRIWILLLTLLITGSNSLLYSQVVYINTEQGIFQMPDGTGSSNRILINNGCGDDNNVLSLAVYKDTVYYNTWAGELKRFKAGVPGSCETLIQNGFSYNSMTVDKNGIIYMATELLVRYDPYTNQLTELGRMPFYSAGDMVFFQDKLLLAGWNPEDWSSGIFEIIPDNLPASKLYMNSPTFFGLISYPVPCGNSRYFGLSPVGDSTDFIEIDLANKTVSNHGMSVPEKILDGGSIAETGIDDKIKITGVVKTNPDVCRNDGGSITLSASSGNNPVTYTLLNTGISQSSGKFIDLRGGLYRFRVTDAAGCSKDTSIAMAENMPLTGCKDIFIPNAFTPNNDGRNDLFSITLSSLFKDASLQIFNRWGNIVHQSKGSTMAWDGYYKGAQQPAGIYIYTLSYTNEAGEKKILKGTLALIK
ncbi:MAG TPA: gliding motility-associated C-terminal domain-containing protein [Chitinophagaceae bacterium]